MPGGGEDDYEEKVTGIMHHTGMFSVRLPGKQKIRQYV